MNINDQVYLIKQGTIHNKTITNSISILPARVESITNDMILIELSTVARQSILMEVRKDELYTTIAKALEETQQVLSLRTDDASLKQDEDES